MDGETPEGKANRRERREHFEVIMPREIFDGLEDWRKGQGWKRSKTICTAVLKLTGQPIPLRNRRPIGYICLGCGLTWDLTKPPTAADHTPPGTFGLGTCKAKVAVMVE